MTSLTGIGQATPYWIPDLGHAANSRLRAFFEIVSRDEPSAPRSGAAYAEWHAWSVREPASFWTALWRFAGIVADERPGRAPWDTALRGGDRMAPPSHAEGPAWFEGARLNFAENLLRHREGAPALVFRGEGARRRELSFAELRAASASVAAALRAEGVEAGDRVAGYLPNIPETVIAMLGAASIGAVWSSCSPDFGVQGVLDRFGQIEPKVLIAADGYRYAGKEIDCLSRVGELGARLPSVRRTVIVPFLHVEPTIEGIPEATLWGDWTARSGLSSLVSGLSFARLTFDHPLYVMYSSGTTGLPKCMVHGAGGTLLQHFKEHALHTDLGEGDRLFYATTCGWMMWNWMVSALATGATIVLYDGAPLPPSAPEALWDLVAEERVNVFGTSAKFLALSEKAGVTPARTHDLSALRSILSTGSPLAPASFDYVASAVKPGVHLASISGGTDLISCFALGNPLLPVYRGELQAPGLGMAVDVFDPTGAPIRGAPGELVCTRPFPSMPVAFWSDPDGAKYRAAYFEFFPGVWRHGDWAEFTLHGGLIIHGRSDATLNPGGVRIGTAEIYRQVEQLPEILESVVIGHDTADGDTQIVLFVRLRDGARLDEVAVERIKRRIRDTLSPHHVPKAVLQVADVPRTLSGKITELAVRDAFDGRPVANTAAMANPQALDEYRELGRRYAR